MIDPRTRRRQAARALADPGAQTSDHRVVVVQCAHGHHVAEVYRTSAGLVYRGIEGPHAHGSRDLQDVAHHGSQHGTAFVDLLVADPQDDALPAWCDCGPRTLSRALLIEAVDGGGGTLRVK